MSQIRISNLTFAYDGSYDNIFENVSFQIDTDWKLGFTGRNGRGKTTFLHLLLGKYPYRGTISSSVTFSYFPFDVLNKSQNTVDVINNVFSNYESWRLSRELSLLDVSEDVLSRPFATLSNGEQTKVLLATLFLKENNFLLIDEPTNHLDTEARKIVSNYLKSKKGYILVSHDRAFLDNCIDHILSINKTNIDIQRGNFSTWWQNKNFQDSFELSENEKLKKDIKRFAEKARTTAEWSSTVEKTKFGVRNSGVKPDKGYIGHQAAKMMKRSKSLQSRQEQAIEEKSKLLKNIETTDKLSIKPLKYYTNRLFEAADLSIFYGDKIICNDVRFTIERGEQIALCGKNGCGKSSILKLLTGEDIPYTGSMRISSGLIVSYIPQDTSFLKGDLRDYAQKHNLDESLFKTLLRKLDVSQVQFEKDMEDYSEGQKKKVLLAKSLCEKAHLYIWDEPLNFIDVLSRIQIEDLIREYKPTMIFVEHDSSFMNTVATKLVQL